jgi:hypothetical protein
MQLDLVRRQGVGVDGHIINVSVEEPIPGLGIAANA